MARPRESALPVPAERERHEQLRRDGMTIFLVEQNANQALKLADRGYVLENGHVVLQDTGAALLANPAVRQAYLGG